MSSKFNKIKRTLVCIRKAQAVMKYKQSKTKNNSVANFSVPNEPNSTYTYHICNLNMNLIILELLTHY